MDNHRTKTAPRSAAADGRSTEVPLLRDLLNYLLENEDPDINWESKLKTAVSTAAKLFPRELQLLKAEGRTPDPEHKHRYLQMLYFLALQAGKKQKGRAGLLDMLSTPRFQYQDQYRQLLSDLARLAPEYRYPAVKQFSDPHSVFTCFEMVALIAHALANKYGDLEGPDRAWVKAILDKNLADYSRKLDALNRQFSPSETAAAHPFFSALQYQLYCFSEFSYLLDASLAMTAIRSFCAQDSRNGGEAPPAEDYLRMRCPEYRKTEEQDRQSLLLRQGRLYLTMPHAGNVPIQEDELYHGADQEVYARALKQYVAENVETLTAKVFCLDEPDSAHQTRLLKARGKILSALEFERRRFGRTSCLSQSKLIAMFQVYFLSTPSAGFVPPKSGIAKETPRAAAAPADSSKQGKPHRVRELRTLSSSYSHVEEKDPFFQHLLCIWADAQVLLNEWGTDWRDRYLAICIQALDTFWSALVPGATDEDIQRQAERILCTAVETLLPDIDGWESAEEFLFLLSVRLIPFPFCCGSLSYRTAPGQDRDAVIRLWGKWLIVMDISPEALADQAARAVLAAAPGQRTDIPLQEACAHALLLSPPKLSIIGDQVLIMPPGTEGGGLFPQTEH